MSEMGVKIDQFEIPVCKSFEAIIMNNQICYEIDLNKFENASNIDNEVKLGFNFLLDYNEDKQVILDDHVINERKNGLASSIVESPQEHAFIYLDTIGMLVMKII